MYLVIELQLCNGTLSHIVSPNYNNINEAYQKFYQVLSAAAISNMDVHAAIILSEHGGVIDAKYFEH